MNKTERKNRAREKQALKKLEQYNWEKEMLEEDSYWDIDILEKSNRESKKNLSYWEKYEPQTQEEKAHKQAQINKYKGKINHYQK